MVTNVKFTPQKREKVLSRLELHEVPKRENFSFDFRIFQLHNAKMIIGFRVQNYTTRKIYVYHIKLYKLK